MTNLVIHILGETKEFNAKLAETEAKLGHVGSSVSTLGSKLKAGLLAGVAGAAALSIESIHLADNFEEAHARLEGAVKATGGNFDELGNQIAETDKHLEAFGFTNEQTESALATLTRASGSTQKAMKLMGLAADLAKGRNIDLGAATNILAKVTTGHVALLGKLGINTKDATGKTISQTEAIKRLTQLYGGQAGTSAETFAGKQEVLKAKLEDLGVKVGSALIPVIEKLADFVVSTVVPAIENLAKWFSKNRDTIVLVAEVIAPLVAGLTALLVLVKVTKAIQTAREAMIAFNIVLAANPVLLVVAAIAALVVGLVIAYQKVGWFRAFVDASFHAIQAVVSFVVDFIKDHWKLLLGILTGPIGLAVLWIVQHWNGIVDFFKKTVGWIRDAFNAVKDAILAPFQAAFEAIKAIYDHTVGPVISAVSGFAGAFGGGGGKAGPSSIKAVVAQQNSNPFGGGKASGGSVSAGMPYVVGERGPELFVPGRSGTIIPNGAGGGNSYTINVMVAPGGDKTELGRVVTEAIDAYERRNGKVYARA